MFPVFAVQIYQEENKKHIVSEKELSDNTYKRYDVNTTYLEFIEFVVKIELQCDFAGLRNIQNQLRMNDKHMYDDTEKIKVFRWPFLNQKINLRNNVKRFFVEIK